MDRKLVLVVDTQEEAANRLAELLAESGLAALSVRTVADARELLCDRPDIGLVLSEVMLPGASGFVLLHQIRRAFEGIPVVLYTAGPDPRIVLQAFRSGAADVLSSPVSGTALQACLDRVMLSGRLHRERLFGLRSMERVLAFQTRELRRMAADLERSYDVTLEAMGDALDLRDEETEGHSKRVTAYTVALAKSMGLDAPELKIIGRGAFLHDVGKIAIPDSILLKPGPLTLDETRIMRRHCEHGYAIVRKIPFLAEAAEIVYAHQERFDGSGYPRGLEGEEIPLGARIFAVADALDAITSDRPYRRGSSFTHALEEIRRGAGTQFDPRVVEAFLQMPRSTWPVIRAEIGRNCHAGEILRAAAA